MRHYRNTLFYKPMNENNYKTARAGGARPLSPCVLICTLDDENRCLGCGRSQAQISYWALMTPDEQWAVIDELALRESEAGATIAPTDGD